MLAELRLLHARILAALDDMEVLTQEQQPRMDRLSATRLNLTKASRKRTAVLEQVYPQLMLQSTPGDKARLQALRVQGAVNLAISSQHIRKWTPQAVFARWPEYCIESRTMQSAMRQRIRDEVSLVYPLLSSPARDELAA
jgi:hypothetical protein